MIRAVIFDVDGTLVDSTYLHTLAWSRALRRHGHDVPMAAVHRAIGMGGDRILDQLVPGRDRADDDALKGVHAALFEQTWPELRPFDGAGELVRACRATGSQVALATSAGERDLKVLREVLDVDDVVDVVTGADDVDRSKPDPDLLLTAAGRLGLDDPAEAVVVGDSVWDVRAARRAGMRCVGVSCGGTGAAELLEAGAVAVHDGPRELLAHLPGTDRPGSTGDVTVLPRRGDAP